MDRYMPIGGVGGNVTISSDVPSKHHTMVLRMLVGQVARVAARLTPEEIYEMNQKYLQVLLAAKTLGVRGSVRLGGAFDLTYDDVVALVDHLVVEPDLPAGLQEYGVKWQLNAHVGEQYRGIRSMGLPTTSPEVSLLVANIVDPTPAVPQDPFNFPWFETPPVMPQATIPPVAPQATVPPVAPQATVLPVAPWYGNSGSSKPEYSAAEIALGAVAIAAMGYAAYSGIKYLAGSAIDAPALSDLDTTL